MATAPKWDDEMLRLASALQKYQHCHSEKKGSETQAHLPQFIIIGQQSFGKTRLLSCIAGCKLGGAERAGTGTRCPVVYSFLYGPTQSFGVGRRFEDMAVKEQNGVARFVTEHMDSLRKEETPEQPGFSNDPIFVKVIGPDVPCFTVVDMPGLKKFDPDNRKFNKDCNQCILDMYKTFYDKSNTVPLLMTKFNDTMDVGETRSDLNVFIEEAELHRYPHLCAKAVVFVSRLDQVKANLTAEGISGLIAHLTKKGFQKQRVIFATLRPDMLGDVKDEKFNGDAQSNEYFERQREEFETANLAAFLDARGISAQDLGCKFGFDPFLETLTADLRSDMKANSVNIQRWLIKSLKEEIQKAEAMILVVEQESLEAKIKAYVQLLGQALAGAATRCDMRRYVDADLAQLNKAYPKCVKLSEDKLANALLSGTKRTFEEEKDRMMVAMPDFDLNTWLCNAETQKVITSKAKLLPEVLRETVSLGGASAVRRFLQYWGIAVMTAPLPYFDKKDLMDKMGGDLSYDKLVQTDWMRVVRSMVEDMAPVQALLKVVVEWCKDIYSSQVLGACKVLREHVHLLNDCPMLRDLIEECFFSQYTDALDSIAMEAMEHISIVTYNRFKLLDLDAAVHFQTLLEATLEKLMDSGCILKGQRPRQAAGPGESVSMLEKCSEGVQKFRETYKNMKEILSVVANSGIMGQTAELTGLIAVGGMSVLQWLVKKSQQGGDSSEVDLALSLLQPTGFEFEIGTEAGPLSEVDCRCQSLNQVAQAVARLHLGQSWFATKDVIYEKFEDKVVQIPQGIPAAMVTLRKRLFSTDYKVLREYLLHGDAQEKMQAMKSVSHRLQELCQDSRSFASVIPSAKEDMEQLVTKAEFARQKLAEEWTSVPSDGCHDPVVIASLKSKLMMELKMDPMDPTDDYGLDESARKLTNKLQEKEREVAKLKAELTRERMEKANIIDVQMEKVAEAYSSEVAKLKAELTKERMEKASILDVQMEKFEETKSSQHDEVAKLKAEVEKERMEKEQIIEGEAARVKMAIAKAAADAIHMERQRAAEADKHCEHDGKSQAPEADKKSENSEHDGKSQDASTPQEISIDDKDAEADKTSEVDGKSQDASTPQEMSIDDKDAEAAKKSELDGNSQAVSTPQEMSIDDKHNILSRMRKYTSMSTMASFPSASSLPSSS